MMGQAVYEGGFTDIGAAYQGKFGAIGRRKLVHADSAGDVGGLDGNVFRCFWVHRPKSMPDCCELSLPSLRLKDKP